MAEQLMYHSKEFPGYIQILPDDNKGPLKDEIGKLTTDDDLGYETRKDVPLVVENSILDKAIEDNRQQAIDKADADREEFDEGTAVEEFFFKVGDPVLLEYDSKGHLTAVKKINEESSGLVEGVGEE